jgi:CopG family nickel-responsive transcriptional regulator
LTRGAAGRIISAGRRRLEDTDVSELVRFGVSMEAGLLAKFDALARRRGAASRSEAIRGLVRDALVDERWEEGTGRAMAALVIVYEHHGDVGARLTRLQHEHPRAVVSSLHIHVDEHRCMEVIVLRGRRSLLSELAHRIIGTRGVLHGRLVTSTTGEELT